MQRARLTTYTNAEIRALLSALHGGSLTKDGLWTPDRARAARARHVSPSTISRWYAGDIDAISPIPVARLRSLQHGHRPTRATRAREAAERTRLAQMAVRKASALSSMSEYDERGWNDPHLLVISRPKDSPLARLTILRADIGGLLKRTAGRRVLVYSLHPDRFAAETRRLDILDELDHLRVRVQRHRGRPGWTQEVLTTGVGWRLRTGEQWGAPLMS